MTLAIPDKQAWLAWRAKGIGGSDAAAAAGLSPWKSPYVLWLEKTGQIMDPTEVTEAMLWGSLLEPVIADEFERREGLLVTDRQLQVEHPQEPWRRATIDGYVATIEDRAPVDRLGVYEGKSTSTLRHALDWSEGIPDHIALQVQHNLAVTDEGRAWVTCLIGGQRLLIEQVDRDQGVIDELLEIEREFWWRVEKLRPPAIDGGQRTNEAIRAAFARSTPGEAEHFEPDILPVLLNLRDARAARKALEQEITAAENLLMAQMGDAEEGFLDGYQVVTWRSHDQRHLDQKALREEEPEIADRFTRTVSVRQFRLKEKALDGS